MHGTQKSNQPYTISRGYTQQSFIARRLHSCHSPRCRNQVFQVFLFRLLQSDQGIQQGSMVHGVVTRRSCLDCYGTTRGSSNASTGSLSTRSLSGSTPLPDSESFKSKYLMQIITQTGPSPPTLVFYIIEISLLLPHDSIRRLQPKN